MGGFLAEILVSFPRCLNPHSLWSLRCRWDSATSRQETDHDLLEMVRESAIQLDFGAKTRMSRGNLMDDFTDLPNSFGDLQPTNL